MGWRIVVAIGVALAAMAPLAHAQSDAGAKCRDAEFDSHSEMLDEAAPFAGATVKSATASSAGGSCRIIAFYRLSPTLPPVATTAERRKQVTEYADKLAAPFFAARLVDDNRKAPFKPRWTDQGRCPALVPALEKLAPILAPKLTGDGPYRELMGAHSSGPTFRLWMTGPVYPQRDEEYTMDLALEGSGGAFGAWLGETLKTLDACWSDAPPELKS